MSRHVVVACLFVLCTTGCGGGGSGGSSSSTTGGTAQVSGVSTPSQVSVVTPVQ